MLLIAQALQWEQHLRFQPVHNMHVLVVRQAIFTVVAVLCLQMSFALALALRRPEVMFRNCGNQTQA